MMKLFVALVLCTIGIAEAASLRDTPGVKVVEDLISPPQKIRGLEELANYLRIKFPLALQEVLSVALPGGLTRHRLALLYNNVRVLDFNIQATSDASGYFTGSASGYIPTIENLDTSVEFQKQQEQKTYSNLHVKEKDLKQATADFINSRNVREDIGNIAAKDISRFTATKVISVDRKNGKPIVVYFCEGVVEDIPTFSRWARVLFNAKDLTVIVGTDRVRYADNGLTNLDKKAERSCPNIQGGNQKYPFPVYGAGSNQVCLNAEVKGKICTLTNKKVTIKSLENGFDRSKAKAVSFKCEDGLNDAINGAYSPAADAFYWFQKFSEFLKSLGIEDPLEKESIVLYLHCGNNMDNSYFDGASIYIGDGSDLLFPLVTPEIIAHELCHCFTARLGNLKFGSESLAIDESHSDICARAFTAYLKIVPDNNWEFGANIVKQNNLALRYFDKPERDEWSIKNVNDLDKITNEFQAVGIFDHVYYLLVDRYNLSFADVFRSAYYANSLYWSETTDFQDAACGWKRAAKDLGLNVAAFDSSFNEVGISLASCSVLGGGR